MFSVPTDRMDLRQNLFKSIDGFLIFMGVVANTQTIPSPRIIFIEFDGLEKRSITVRRSPIDVQHRLLWNEIEWIRWFEAERKS